MERSSLCFLFVFTVLVFGPLSSVSTVAEDATEAKDDIKEVKMEVVKKPKFCLRRAKSGDILLLKMEGKIISTGQIFETNLKEKQPYVFQYRGGQMDVEMENAMNDMCAGETRKIQIPGGVEGRRNFTAKSGIEVSANSSLEFLVQLQEIQDSPDHVMVFNLLNTDKSGTLSVAQFMAIAAQGLDMFPLISSLEEMEVIIEEAFRVSDKDGDGRLDLEEYLDSPLVTAENTEHAEAIHKRLEELREQKAAKAAKAKGPEKKTREEL